MNYPIELKKYNKLKNWFSSTDTIFKNFRPYVLDYKIRLQRRIFIDNNSDILFVAHADTILPPRMIRQTKDVICATGLDDRLGCYIAWILSKRYNCDLLITDLEEKGLSTANHHICKNYSWIVEFDRAGNDIVTYELDNEEFRQAITGYWKHEHGLFSDISSLETTACCMNLGIGYYKAHDKNSYAIKKIYREQLNLFDMFFNQYKNTDFGKRDEKTTNWNTYSDYAAVDICDFCNIATGDAIHEYFICPDCFEQLIENDIPSHLLF